MYYLSPDGEQTKPIPPEQKRDVWLTEMNTGNKIVLLSLDGYETYRLAKQLEQGWMYEGLKD
jgi:hypothetical protein